MRFPLFAALALALAACESGAKHDDAPPPATAPDPSASKPAHPANGPKVYFATPKGEIAVDVEVVATEAKVERGLMYRQYLPPDDGMLFLMDKVQEWNFWMHNTLIPLDMIFIRTDLTIAGIVENAEPQTDTLRTVGEVSQYVVEVNGGWTAAHGVKKDQKVRFDHVR